MGEDSSTGVMYALIPAYRPGVDHVGVPTGLNHNGRHNDKAVQPTSSPLHVEIINAAVVNGGVSNLNIPVLRSGLLRDELQNVQLLGVREQVRFELSNDGLKLYYKLPVP